MLRIILIPAVYYFLAVFLAGFVLGVVRELWLIQWMSQRQAELLEMPVLLGVAFIAARYLVVQQAIKPTSGRFLTIGLLALLFMLGLELTVVLYLRGLSLSTYIESRDVIAGSAYLASLLIFMLMPWLIAQFGGSKQS